MTEVPILILACVAGVALGMMFFGGLWWTLRKGVSSESPALWFIGSVLLRMTLALSGFYFVSGGQWRRLLSCVLGFFAARVAVTWLTRQSGEPQTRPAHQVRHAS